MSNNVFKMSNHNITFIVFLVSVCIAARAETEPGTESFEDLITKLKYGERCSWKAEKIRQSYVETIIGMPERMLTTLEEFKLNATKNGEGFCNTLGLLICNKETETCGCGDPGRAVLLGQQAGSKHYVVETTDDDQQRCRWAENGGCAPVDNSNESPVTLSSKCQKGTSCLANGKEHACSQLDISLYVLNNQHTGVATLSKDVLNGKICSCRSRGQTQSQGDNLDKQTDRTNSRARRFASAWQLNPHMSVYGGVIAPFVESFY